MRLGRMRRVLKNRAEGKRKRRGEGIKKEGRKRRGNKKEKGEDMREEIK